MAKKCTKCKTIYDKPKEGFYRDKNSKDGFYAQCKICHNTTRAKYRATSKGKSVSRNTYLKFTYGITSAEYNKRFAFQKGCCLICGKHQSKLTHRLAVDHDHETEKLRGLLCKRCNAGLGNFNDNIELLFKAINYLKQFKE